MKNTIIADGGSTILISQFAKTFVYQKANVKMQSFDDGVLVNKEVTIKPNDVLGQTFVTNNDLITYLNTFCQTSSGGGGSSVSIIPDELTHSILDITVSGLNTIDAGARFVSIYNNDINNTGVNALVDGKQLPPGLSETFPFAGGTLDAITYNSNGSTLRILIIK